MHTSQTAGIFSSCPHCKSARITSQNAHRYVCANCKFEYFHNSAAAVAAIIEFENKVLFTVRANSPAKGLLDLPGGFVDHNESLEQALTREVNEELGITIHHWRYLASAANRYHYKGIDYCTCDCVFYAQLDSQPKLKLQHQEIVQTRWLSTGQIEKQEIAFDSTRQLIEAYVKNGVRYTLN